MGSQKNQKISSAPKKEERPHFFQPPGLRLGGGVPPPPPVPPLPAAPGPYHTFWLPVCRQKVTSIGATHPPSISHTFTTWSIACNVVKLCIEEKKSPPLPPQKVGYYQLGKNTREGGNFLGSSASTRGIKWASTRGEGNFLGGQIGENTRRGECQFSWQEK